MAIRNMKQKSVQSHDFSMIPRADIPRSSFPVDSGLKTTFSAAYLVPIFLTDVLPGDSFHVNATIVCRTQTPIAPIMDNWHLETFFFFVPNRLVWTNWQRFCGEQSNPGDSTNYVIPQIVSPVGGYAADTLADYFGLPLSGQIAAGNTYSHSALPFRAYSLIYDAWFRDENLQNAGPLPPWGDGPDANNIHNLQKRGKRHDYFTSALPWTQKAGQVTTPLSGTALVKTSPGETFTGANTGLVMRRSDTGALVGSNYFGGTGSGFMATGTSASGGTFTPTANIYPTNLYADLSTATATTVNQLRQSFQIQKLYERDARGGTRYTEVVRSHFGVISPDARLQRPEYIGGGRIPILTQAIPQTSATGVTGATTPMGTLAAIGQAQGRNGFSFSATEHGFIIGLANVRADLTYQQGLPRLWTRTTRFDHYWPVFAMLGEQPIFNREIYADGSATDSQVFGYQERWSEYRQFPARITGRFRSTHPTPIDYWHSAQKFTGVPTLNSTFITDQSDVVLQRNFAGGAQTAGQQFLCDIHFGGQVARQMPKYSVPGMIDHF